MVATTLAAALAQAVGVDFEVPDGGETIPLPGFAVVVGFFSVVIAYFAGGLIAELVTRVTGYKHGPVMLGIVVGGILAGTVVGAVGAFWLDYGMLYQGASNDPESEYYLPVQRLLIDAATWSLLSAGAAAVGAWQRLRW